MPAACRHGPAALPVPPVVTICLRLLTVPAVRKPDHHGGITIYYRCPHDAANPRHRAAHPDHLPVSVREDAMMTALATFFDQYVFGHDRAALLAAQLPATAADHADQQARLEAHLRTELARIDVAERALIDELEKPADPADPAARAYRDRIRERFAERYAERTKIEAQLAALQDTAAPQDHDPALLDQLPTAAAVMAAAPQRIREALINAFDIQALYNKEMDQVTIWASLTEDTPRTVAAILADPRTDDDTGRTAVHSGPGPIVHQILPRTRILPNNPAAGRTTTLTRLILRSRPTPQVKGPRHSATQGPI